MFHVKLFSLASLLAVAGCTYASPIMDSGDGAYFVSTRGAPAAGGTAGAYRRASQEMTSFCASKGGRPIMEGSQDRDVYQSGYGGGFSGTPHGGYSGGFAGGTNASGVANVRFRCG